MVKGNGKCCGFGFGFSRTHLPGAGAYVCNARTAFVSKGDGWMQQKAMMGTPEEVLQVQASRRHVVAGKQILLSQLVHDRCCTWS